MSLFFQVRVVASSLKGDRAAENMLEKQELLGGCQEKRDAEVVGEASGPQLFLG